MKIVKPIEVTESKLIYSSIPEPDISANEIEWKADDGAEIQTPYSSPYSKRVHQAGTNGYIMSGGNNQNDALRIDPSFNLLSSVQINPTNGWIKATTVKDGLLYKTQFTNGSLRMDVYKYNDFSLTTQTLVESQLLFSESDWGWELGSSVGSMAIISDFIFF